MILNFEIDEQRGKILDALASAGVRSRRAQARKLIEDQLDMLASDSYERESDRPVSQDPEAVNQSGYST